jgi:hypothetical protein
MKKIMVIFIVAFGISSVQAQSPNWNEWFKQKKTQRKYLATQIAALQVYLGYLKKGYEIVDKGLNLIGDIKNGTLNLDKEYFNSLKQVSHVIRKSPKVNEILIYQQAIIKVFKELLSFCQNSKQYTNPEIDYVKSVYNGMLTQGDNSVDELTKITTAGEAEMTDDERLLRLDNVHADLQDQYAFTMDFVAGTKLIAFQRAKEKHELESVRKLNSKQ